MKKEEEKKPVPVIRTIKKIVKKALEEQNYVSKKGHTMKRETGTKTPGGNTTSGEWVVRDKKHRFVDFHKYRNDLIDKHKLSKKD